MGSRDVELSAFVAERWDRLVRTAVLLGCQRAEAEDIVPAGPAPRTPSPLVTTLEGRWTVTALVSSEPTPTKVPDYYTGRVTLTFSPGRVYGYTGCNSVWASYEQSGDQGADITFKAQGTTQVACPDEPELLDRLSAVRHVSGAGSTRYLLSAGDEVIVELERR